MVKPVEKVGVYGGSLRRGLRGSADHNGILRMVGNQGLVRWNSEFTEVLPNVAEKWEVSPDARVFTMTLRKGMKWSDGKPFTADDVVFAVEDGAKNTELYKSPPTQLSIGGKPVLCEKVDDHVVRFTFAGPYALFLEQMATPLGQHPTLFPKHYCSQFHPKYNAKVGELAKAANLSDWGALFRSKCGDIEIPSRWGNPEKPTLDPWVVKEPYTGGATRVTMERNPYFWQVDTAGNQLPYIDRIAFSISQDVQSLMLDAVSGKLDLQERPHLLAAEQADARAEPEEGRLSPLRSRLLVGPAMPDVHEHHPQGSEDAGDVRQQGIPSGAVAGDQPQGDHRARLSRPVRALSDGAPAFPSLVS